MLAATTLCLPSRTRTPNAIPVRLMPGRVVLILISFFFFSFSTYGQAPDIEWQKTFGGTHYDEAECIVQTTDGGYIIAGWTYSTDGDITNAYSNGYGDAWVIKTDPVGNIQWQKIIGGNGYEDALMIRQTGDGGYILTGHTSSKDGDLSMNYNDSYDALVVKLDGSGNIQWIRNIGGWGYDVLISVETDPAGGYILGGYSGSNNEDVSGNHGDLDAWIVKLDNAGNIVWQKSVGGSLKDVSWSVVPVSGGYIFGGHSQSSNGDISTNRGQFDVMVGKLDLSGNLLWVKTMGGSGDDWTNEMIATSDGGVILTGYTFSSNGDVSLNRGQNDVWVIKLDGSGNLQWQRTYGGSDYDEAHSIKQTADGGFVVAGRSRSGNGDVSGNHGDNDYWVFRIDITGNIIWQKSLGGTQQDVAHWIEPTSDGSFIIAGTSHSSDGEITYNRGRSDIWIVKLGLCALNEPAVPAIVNGSGTPCANVATTYSIDAVADATGYTWTVPVGWTIISGQGTTSISVLPATNAGNISVLAFNTCRTSTRQLLAVVPYTVPTPQVLVTVFPTAVICEGVQVDFTAEASGVVDPVYQWKKNGINTGTGTDTYRDWTLQQGDVITCEVTSFTPCGNRTITPTGITMTVITPVTPGVSVTASDTKICVGQSVEFTATTVNAGSSPVYQWLVNNQPAGTNAPVFRSSALADGDLVSCRILASLSCMSVPEASSVPVGISVDSDITSAVDISSPKTTICKNERLEFTASVINAGQSPVYQWKINGAPAASGSPVFTSSNLSNRDVVTCMVTPGTGTCATLPVSSNGIAIIINTLPAVSITPADTTVRPGVQVQLRGGISEPVRAFEWSPGSLLTTPGTLSPLTVPVLERMDYRLQVTTNDGCIITKTATVKPQIAVYVPTAFTPNGDGLNDRYGLAPDTNLELEEFAVFNRWGVKVFATSDLRIQWNGKYKGIDQPADTYIFQLKGKQENKPVFMKGTFSLIR